MRTRPILSPEPAFQKTAAGNSAVPTQKPPASSRDLTRFGHPVPFFLRPRMLVLPKERWEKIAGPQKKAWLLEEIIRAYFIPSLTHLITNAHRTDRLNYERAYHAFGSWEKAWRTAERVHHGEVSLHAVCADPPAPRVPLVRNLHPRIWRGMTRDQKRAWIVNEMINEFIKPGLEVFLIGLQSTNPKFFERARKAFDGSIASAIDAARAEHARRQQPSQEPKPAPSWVFDVRF